MDEMIVFTDDEGNEIEFGIIAETKINSVNYIPVADANEDDEAEAFILKDVSDDEDEEAVYEMVSDEQEVSYIGKVFSEQLEDVEVEY